MKKSAQKLSSFLISQCKLLFIWPINHLMKLKYMIITNKRSFELSENKKQRCLKVLKLAYTVSSFKSIKSKIQFNWRIHNCQFQTWNCSCVEGKYWNCYRRNSASIWVFEFEGVFWPSLKLLVIFCIETPQKQEFTWVFWCWIAIERKNFFQTWLRKNRTQERW